MQKAIFFIFFLFTFIKIKLQSLFHLYHLFIIPNFHHIELFSCLHSTEELGKCKNLETHVEKSRSLSAIHIIHCAFTG